MGSALVVFGSASDREVFEALSLELRRRKCRFALRIASAHRSPELLNDILENTAFDVAVCGAGLSAALPGVVAAQTLKPVIGIPVSGNYEGIDAFLSTTQIPPGVAVLGTPIDAGEQAGTEAAKILNAACRKVVLVKRGEDADTLKAVNKAETILQQFGIKYTHSSVPSYTNSNALYIDFIPLQEVEALQKTDALVIYVPVAPKGGSLKQLPYLTRIKYGLWVGLGRGENAALAAVQAMNREEQFNEALLRFREVQKEKVMASNEKEKLDE